MGVTPNLGIAERRFPFYYANFYATCLLVLSLPMLGDVYITFPILRKIRQKIVEGWFSFPVRRVARQCRETMTMTTLARLFCERVRMYATGKVPPPPRDIC